MTPHARTTDPDTSHAAAASVDPDHRTQTQRNIVALLRAYGPLTDEALAATWAASGFPAVSPSGLRSRRAELVAAGLLIDTGYRERTAAGRATIQWGVAK